MSAVLLPHNLRKDVSNLIITGDTVRELMTSAVSEYEPESKNSHVTKEFLLKGNYNELLKGYENQFRNNPHALKILTESRSIIELGGVRQYTTDKYFKVDNVNTLACLGLNAKGEIYSSYAIYDVSNLLSLALSIFFDTTLEKIENGIARYVAHADISYFDVIGALSSRFDVCSDAIRLDEFDIIDKGFNTFIEKCYVNYTNDNFWLNGNYLSKDEYPFSDILKVALQFFITKINEKVLEGIMQEVVESRNEEEGRTEIVVQSKGLDNILIASNNSNNFKPFVLKCREIYVILQPTIISSKHKLAESFIKTRTESFGLMTTLCK